MKKQKEFTGIVISTSMTNTVVVSVERLTRHPMYRKSVKRTKHFVAHVEGIELVVGDWVRIGETKPMSKTKHFIVLGKTTK
jgi:small subunit ribosomal protein S17